MGIYGHKFDAFGKNIEHQKPEIDQGITIEIYVDSDLYNQLLEEKFLIPLQENVSARAYLKDEDAKEITLFIRDNITMSYGNTKGNHGPSVKIVRPESVVGSGIDIIIPAFKKTGEAPYKGAKVPGEFTGSSKAVIDPNCEKNIKKKKGSYPDEINLALKFVDDYHKKLLLIFNKPENEYNQYQLLQSIVKKCDYMTKIVVGNKDRQEKFNKIIENKKSNKKDKEKKENENSAI